MNWFINLSVKKPWRVIAITALAALISASLSLGLRIDSNVLAMLPDDLPVAQHFARVAEEFGAANPIVVAVLPANDADPSIASRETAISLIGDIEAALKQARFAEDLLFTSVDGVRDGELAQQQLETILPLTPRFMAAEDLDNVIARLRPALVKHRLSAATGWAPNNLAPARPRGPMVILV